MEATSQPQVPWTADLLEPMRHIGDAEADAAVSAVFSAGDVPAVNAMMRTLVENDGIPPQGLPPAILDYLAHSERLPEWADAAKIRAGEQLFWRFGPEMIAILFCYSLPFCYAGKKGVQVLWLTSRLYTNATRRVIETAQMVVDVMRAGGLAPGGVGVRTAQKVRLMHAGVRYQIRNYKDWNPENGAPVNQEDLAGTLMSFSWVVLDGLARLGFRLTPDEAEAYLHSWKVVGHILGVRPELLPADVAAAEALSRAIQRRQYAACIEGQQMTRALIEMMQHFLPGNLFDRVPETMVRYFLGDAGADLLAVRPSDPAAALLAPMRVLNGLLGERMRELQPLSRLHAVFSRRLIESLLWVERGGQRIPFDIPAELKQTWGVNWQA